jgi:DNA-binding NtrC family response regulator
LFELADGGTVLLDEIGDMKLSMQAKLLRVLETRRFRRVGGEQDISVNVRVIACTNRDLDQMVARGEFRQDLLYRLKVISVRMPSLLDRPEDIPLLARHFLSAFASEFKRPPQTFSKTSEEALMKYSWPGNVRELRNVIERLVILESDTEILPRHLPSEIAAGSSGRDAGTGHWVVQLPPGGVALSNVERELVMQAMERTGGNQTQAAQLLGIERDALRRRLIKYGVLEVATEASAA